MSKHPLALIIGGSSGIGKETARRLLERGLDVILVSKDPLKLNKAKEELQKNSSGTVETMEINLYNEKQVNALIAFIQNEERPIIHLLNAAGVFQPKKFLDFCKADYEMYMGLNMSFFFITRAVIEKMKKQGGGSIVNIGSMWAKRAIKASPSSAYSMAKSALHSLTQHLALEHAEDNIRVNAVSPALMLTPVSEAFVHTHPDENTRNNHSKQFYPVERVGTVAAVIDFLFSNEARWITGVVWDVDGGVLAAHEKNGNHH